MRYRVHGLIESHEGDQISGLVSLLRLSQLYMLHNLARGAGVTSRRDATSGRVLWRLTVCACFYNRR
jgi:hypothetical protein